MDEIDNKRRLDTERFDAALAAQQYVITETQTTTDAAVKSLREAVSSTNATVQGLSQQVGQMATQIASMSTQLAAVLAAVQARAS